MPCTLTLLNGPMEGFTVSVDETGYARVGKVNDSLLPLHFDDGFPEGVFFDIYVIGERMFIRDGRSGRLKVYREDTGHPREAGSGWQETEKGTMVLIGGNLVGIGKSEIR